MLDFLSDHSFFVLLGFIGAMGWFLGSRPVHRGRRALVDPYGTTFEPHLMQRLGQYLLSWAGIALVCAAGLRIVMEFLPGLFVSVLIATVALVLWFCIFENET